jgi:hypothetical protein
MIKRRRFKQTTSHSERLMENVEQLRQQLAKDPPAQHATSWSGESVSAKPPLISGTG